MPFPHLFNTRRVVRIQLHKYTHTRAHTCTSTYTSVHVSVCVYVYIPCDYQTRVAKQRVMRRQRRERQRQIGGEAEER